MFTLTFYLLFTLLLSTFTSISFTHIDCPSYPVVLWGVEREGKVKVKGGVRGGEVKVKG